MSNPAVEAFESFNPNRLGDKRRSNGRPATFRFLDNPLFDAGLIVIGFMLAYHTANGIRLTLTEFGFLQGRPTRPDFPYVPKSFSKAQRALFWLSVLFAAGAAVYALNAFFGA